MKASYVSPLRARYRRPGGPWDPATVGTLDDLFTVEAPGTADRVARAAGGLRARGVRRGEVVAWQLPNVDDAVVLFRACWRLGAVAAPLHHQASAAELDRLVGALAPRYVHAPEDPLPDGPPLRYRRSAPAARPSDVAVVLHTAGSSGAPKGVLHTHRSLAAKARLMVRVHGLGGGDAVLVPAPLAHISGLLNGVLVPGAARMRACLQARWDPDEAAAVIERERITFMIGPPTYFLDLAGAASFRRDRMASLRLVSCGGAGVTPAFVTRTAEALGAVVKRTYGSTEAPTVTTWQQGDPPERAATTDGRPTGEAEVRLARDTGELLVRGPEVFAGYVDAARNAAAFTPGGWFRTGDLAHLDDDGWVTITGRRRDLIIRGGENIAPAEVEAVLEAHPAVRQAVVVGIPDDRLGERVAACLVADAASSVGERAAGEDPWRQWCTDHGLARFKAPDRVLVVDALPVLAPGKPDRAAVRDLLARSVARQG